MEDDLRQVRGAGPSQASTNPGAPAGEAEGGRAVSCLGGRLWKPG